MMDGMRRAAKSWVAKVLIALLVLSFAVWGIEDMFRGNFFSGRSLASVGAKELAPQEFTQAFQRALQNMSQQRGETVTPEKARAEGLDRIILANLLRGLGLDAQADKLGLAISDETIVSEIKGNPAFLGEDGKFSTVKFQQVLANNGLSEAGFIAATREDKLRDAIANAVEADFVPPKTQLEAYHRYENEARDARYFTVTVAESDVPAPTDAEIKEHYDKNIQNYTAPEYRSIAILKAEPADISSQTSVTDVELKEAYEKRKQSYFTPEKRTVLQIVFNTMEEAKKAKERIAAGTDFLEIAKEKELSAQDATLGTVARNEIFDTKIADAVFKLSEGAVSDPVQGQLSIVLVKVLTKSPEHQQSFEEAKADLTQKLKLEKAAEALKSIYDAVEDARAGQTPFEEIAKTQKLPLIAIAATDAEGLDKDGKPIVAPEKDEIVKRAFASDPGVENEALPTATDGYLWYEVREVVPAKPRPLDTVKDKVKADLIAKKLREFALDKAKKLTGRAASGIDALAKDAGAEAKTVQRLKRNETDAELDASAVSALFSLPEKGIGYAPGNDGKSAKIIEAAKVATPKFDAKQAGVATMRKTLADNAGADLFETYQAALQGNLGVTVNETLWRQIAGTP